MQNNRNRSRSASSQDSARGGDNFVEPSKRVFVAGISRTVRENDIRKLFEDLGAVNDFFFKIPEDTEKSGFAFIEMGSVSEAEQAISSLSGKKMGDKMIMVKFAKPRGPKKEGGFERREGGFEKGQGRGGFNREDRGRNNNQGKFNSGGNGRWNKGEDERGDNDRGGSGRQEGRGGFGGGNRGGFNGGGERNGFQKREERQFEGNNNRGKQESKMPTSRSPVEDIDY